MYTLVSAFGKLKAVGSRWMSTDISAIAMNQLIQEYDEIYVSLSNPFYNTPVTLKLSDIRNNNLTTTSTLQQYLDSIADGALPVVQESYQVKDTWIGYSDAFRAGYKLEPVSQNGHIGSTIPMSERTWLSMTRSDTDYREFFKHCLVTVNGLIHRTDTDGQRMYVVDAMKSCRHSGKNQIGITSFAKIGELTFTSITETMLHRRHPDESMGERVYIDIGQAVPGKTPLLVVGGYLHLLDQREFFQVSDSIYAYNIRNVPWRERFFEMKKLLDLPFLDLETFTHNENQVVEEEIFSDAFITKIFTLSQSFIVWVDAVDLFVERESLRRTRLPHMYTSYVKPTYPLLTGYGKLSEYWSVPEDGQWAINCIDSIKWNYDFNTTPEDSLVSFDNSAVPFNPMEYCRAEFLKIGRSALVKVED